MVEHLHFFIYFSIFLMSLMFLLVDNVTAKKVIRELKAINPLARVKRYVCELCGNRYVENSQLKVHRLTHSDEKQFKCEHCGKRYTVLLQRRMIR